MILPCYFLCTLYLWKIARKEEDFKNNSNRKIHAALLTGVVGTLYAVWLIYAAGLGLMLVAAIIYSLGIPIFWMARKEAGAISQINHVEKLFMVLIVVAAVVGIFYTAANFTSLMGGQA